jgi:hypothetical protein
MLLKGFEENSELQEYLSSLDDTELKAFTSKHKEVSLTRDVLSYSVPGLPVCWKCTLKHLGQAVVFAAELDKYPERVGCVVGELGHAYRECPDKNISEKLHETYQRILDTGCIPDFTRLLKLVTEGWRESLAEDSVPHYQV